MPTLILSRSDVQQALSPEACLLAVEDALRRHALGEVPSPAVLAMHAADGGFHVKAALLASGERSFFAAKVNANFPGNSRHGLPTIQGVVALCDANDGQLLALMDSVSITALRTAAATAVAAKHLANERCDTLLLCGCGAQAWEQLRALQIVRKPARVCVYDVAPGKAAAFAAAHQPKSPCIIEAVDDLAGSARDSGIVITCTTSRRAFLLDDMIRSGTFIAAVGADNEDKQELDPALLARSKLVTDLTAQCAAIGELHHAIDAGLMAAGDVHAQLGEVIAGLRPGRESSGEVLVFDSTGIAIQDVSAAATAYTQALEWGLGTRCDFSGGLR